LRCKDIKNFPKCKVYIAKSAIFTKYFYKWRARNDSLLCYGKNEIRRNIGNAPVGGYKTPHAGIAIAARGNAHRRRRNLPSPQAAFLAFLSG
jgi:hypothetical protein